MSGPSPTRSAALLGLAGLLATALLVGLHGLTRDRIAQRDRERALDQLAAVLPIPAYDNDPLADTITVVDPRLGPGGHTVHRARLKGSPSAVAINAIATDGYGGPIGLIVGVDIEGRILGVRVLAHSETPGLGDPIDVRRSDWIRGFEGRSLDDPPPVRWTVRPEGGDFDAFTGATITPRAVTRAVHRVLAFHQAERDRLHAPSTGHDDSATP
jgi:electron transport complex protein RnfG